ncbi:hypothetical protein J4208_05175 [Candidatus Woesearchaeota archaeon]|nr:hypothetical protein [Candidatus Woesearchaeota archaeon]
MTNVLNLDVLLKDYPFGTGQHCPILSKLFWQYIRTEHPDFLRHSERSLFLPVAQSLPWSRIQRYAADALFRTILLTRLNEVASNGITCDVRTYALPQEQQPSQKKKGTLGHLVFETAYDATAKPLAELGFDKMVWPRF